MEPTAIVTGASRGFGLALTRGLSGRGWRVVVDARDAAALTAAVAGLPGVTAVPGDITAPDHRAALVGAAGRQVDALVLSAGTLGPTPLPPVARTDPHDLAATLAVNVVAQLALVQAALDRLAAGGRIVAITSDAAREPYPGWGAYGASKAALEQLVAVLAAERPDLRVHRVDPGDLRTRMQQDAFPGEDVSDRPPPEVAVPGLLRLLEEDLPSGRWSAQELAREVVG